MSAIDILFKQVGDARVSLANATHAIAKLASIKRSLRRDYMRVYMKHKMRTYRGVGTMDNPELDAAREQYAKRRALVNARLATLVRQQRDAKRTLRLLGHELNELVDTRRRKA